MTQVGRKTGIMSGKRVGRHLSFNKRSDGGLPPDLAELFSILWTTTVEGDELPSQDGNNIVITDKDFTVTSHVPAGSEATFSLPDVAGLKVDDEDNLWFDESGNVLQLTVTDLVGQDYTRTLVKYSNFEPYNIDWIGVLKSTANPTTDQWNQLYRYFQLWFLREGTIHDYGVLKENRTLGVVEAVPVDFELISRGNGTVVSTLNISSTHDFELSIDGEGSFYNDFNQTIPLGNPYIVTSRSKAIYIKLTSGIATLTISDSEAITKLGSDAKSFWSYSTNSPGIDISNIGQLTNLTYIYSLGTGIIGDITELFESPNIEYIDFWGGGTTGDITNIDRAINLKSLSLSSSLNRYSGSITNIQYLYELEKLSISSDYLTGNINGFGSLTKLKEITLTCPLVSGIISNLNGLILLEKLNLTSNLFTGTISSISDLVNLNSLTLGSNDISGSVTNLYSFPLLNTIFILSNTFTGELHSLDQLTLLRNIRIVTNSASVTFNSDDAWAVDSNNFIVYINISGLSTGQVDNIIIAFSKINSFVSGSLGTPSILKRTAASDTAYNTLISRGVTVNINIEE